MSKSPGVVAPANSGPLARVFRRGGRALGVTSLALWVAVLLAVDAVCYERPTPANLLLLVVLVALCAVTHLQIRALNWSRAWTWRQATMLLYSSRYLSEVRGVVGRDAFMRLVEASTARPGLKASETALVVVSVRDLDGLRSRLGDLGGRKAVAELASTLRRATRGDDVVGYLGEGAFGVLLPHCSPEQCECYLRRLPEELAVSAGGNTVNVGIDAVASDVREGLALLGLVGSLSPSALAPLEAGLGALEGCQP